MAAVLEVVAAPEVADAAPREVVAAAALATAAVLGVAVVVVVHRAGEVAPVHRGAHAVVAVVVVAAAPCVAARRIKRGECFLPKEMSLVTVDCCSIY